jgi:hypothetical protein
MRDPIYEFPPAEVAAGEYIALYLRTPETGAAEALSESREFWVPGSVKRLRKTDAVLIMDQNDGIIDGVLLSEAPTPSWAKDDLTKAAELLAAGNAWVSAGPGKSAPPTPADAVITKGATTTRTVCRDETAANSKSAADWYITATSKASPGKPNNPERYQP